MLEYFPLHVTRHEFFRCDVCDGAYIMILKGRSEIVHQIRELFAC